MSRLDDTAKAVLKEAFFNNDDEKLAMFVDMVNAGDEVNSDTPYKMAALLITE